MAKNVKGTGKWAGKNVPGMYKDGGSLKKAQDGKSLFMDPRVDQYQAKSDSIHSLLSGPPENYKGSQLYSGGYEEGELDAPLSNEQMDEIDPWFREDEMNKIDPLNMTDEQMSMFDEQSYSWNPTKQGSLSPKISSYREMKEHDSQVNRLSEQRDKMNKMMQSGMSEEDAKKMINYKKKGGFVKGTASWKGKNVPGMRYD